MDNRKWQANAAASPPSVPASPSSGYPTNGGVSVTPTTPGDWWYHQIGEEIRSVIVAAALTPTHNVVDQLLTAIKKGFGQVWTDVTGSRVAGTTYTNSNGFPLFVAVVGTSSTSPAALVATINGVSGVVVGGPTPGTSSGTGVFFVVPPGQTYSVTFNAGTPTLSSWKELK